MTDPGRKEKLERRVEQTRRLSKEPHDPTTKSGWTG